MAVLDIEGFTDVTPLGGGGFATVYRAIDLSSREYVAIKVLNRLETDKELGFERELRSYGALAGHPNILGVIGSGRTSENRPYLVLPYMPGGSLHDLAAAEPLTASETAWVGDQVLAALEWAHSKEIWHRDIKPANILLGRGELKLADFGLAKFADTTQTTASAIAATVAFAAPEILLGKPATARSDLYSLGATLHRLVTGKNVYDEWPDAVAAATAPNPQGPDLSGVPPELLGAISHLLRTAPDQRPLSAAFARAELAPVVPQGPSLRLSTVLNAQQTAGTAGPDVTEGRSEAPTFFPVIPPRDSDTHPEQDAPPRNPRQTPTRDFKLQGELYLARSNRKRVVAAPLPRQLAAALHDDSMFARLGAVGELRARLNSSDLPTALGAHAALTDVARNDILYVADAATSAIEGAALAAAETTLEFGEVEAGRESAALSLRLLGPAIALSATAEPSARWMLVAPTAAGFDVSVLTDRVGVQRGSITVSGPTGSVDVDVTAHVRAAQLVETRDEAAQTMIEPTGEPITEHTVEDKVQAATNPPAARAVPMTHVEVQPAPQPGRRSPVAESQELGFTTVTKFAVGGALTAGLLLVVGMGTLVPDEGSSGLISPPFLPTPALMAVFGVGAVASAGGLLVGRLRAVAAGILLSFGAAAPWLLPALVEVQFSAYAIGWSLALYGSLALILTAIVAALDLSRAGLLGLRRPRGRQAYVVVVASSLGLFSMVVQAATISDYSGVTWLVLTTLWLAALAVALPLVAVSLRQDRVRVGVLVGWVLGGAGIGAYYVMGIRDIGESLVAITLFGVSLFVAATLAALFRGRLSPTKRAWK